MVMYPLEKKYAEACERRRAPTGTRAERLEAEKAKLRRLMRPGYDEKLIERGAINALMERGEW